MKIILLQTSSSTIVIPVLTAENVNLSTELTEISNEQLTIANTLANVFSNEDGVISIASNMANKDNIIKPIIIPNNFEGNDNESSIAKVLEFFKTCSSTPFSMDIKELNFGSFNLAGKIIKIKNE